MSKLTIQQLITLKKYTKTERQLKALEVLIKVKSTTMAAVELDITERNVCKLVERIKENAAKSGYDIDNNRLIDNGPTQVVSGYSSLVRMPENDPAGRILEWVKTNRRIADQLEDAKVAIQAFASEIEPVKIISKPKFKANPNNFTVIPLGDPHIGLMTWAKEVGSGS